MEDVSVTVRYLGGVPFAFVDNVRFRLDQVVAIVHNITSTKVLLCNDTTVTVDRKYADALDNIFLGR